MRTYKCLQKQEVERGNYKLVPIREEDKYAIMQWRNEQIYHLRQPAPLTETAQDSYFSYVIATLFTQEKPNQLLFSYLENGICIGYGGLVHINWVDKNAEISFIINTSLEEKYFEFHWSNYLKLLEKAAFDDLKLHKIYTYAFDLRPHLYGVLLKNKYVEEARLKEHCFFDGKYLAVLIHAKWNNAIQIHFRNATENDLDLYFHWANEKITRQNSHYSAEISYASHSAWFKQKLVEKSTMMLVFEDEGNIPVGQIRIEKKKEEIIISISLDENFRGKGLASKMIAKACDEYVQAFAKEPIIAYIKSENIASRKAFEKAGFVFVEEKEVQGVSSIILIKSPIHV